MHFAIKEIKRRKIRNLINIFGYIIAVSFLIIIVSLSQGYNIVASGELRGIGTHFVAYIPSSTVCPCEFRDAGPFFKEVYTPSFNSSIVEKIEDLPGVEDAAPYLMFKLDNLTIAGIEVDSIATEATAVSPGTIIEGKFLKKEDIDGVLVEQIYANLMNFNVGDKVNLFGKTFRVVGIVNPNLFSKPAGNAQIYGLLSVVQEIAHSYGTLLGFIVYDVNVVLVEISPLGDTEYLNTVKESVLDTLEYEVGTKGALAGYQCGVKARKIVSLTENTAWLTSTILIVAAILYSLKSQFATIYERTKEIGILKAIGWTNLDITKEIFFESFLQGTIGGIGGLILGYLCISIITIFGLVPIENLIFSVSPILIILGITSSIIGGIIAGMIPAWSAAKLEPAKALRHF
jgi:putative ABC transport system permease protein